MKKHLSLLFALAVVLSLSALAACGKEEAPPVAPSSRLLGSSDTAGASDTSGIPSGEPVPIEPEMTAANAAITMRVQQYPGGDFARAVEIPQVTGEGPGVEIADTPFLHLAEERNRLLSQGSGEILEVHAYPFTREDWIQVLTTSFHYQSDGNLVVESANYDVKGGGFVTPIQALERLSLTAEGLEQKLIAQNLQPEEYETELLHLWQPAAFFVRQDGSMVFFLLAEYLIVGNPDAMGPRAMVCYDSTGGEFSLTPPDELLSAAGPDRMEPPLWYGQKG